MVAVIYSLLWIIAAWKWGKWRNWQQYYPTMLFSAIGNLLYEVLCAQEQMWSMEANGLPNQTIPILLLSFIGMPLSTFLYLCYYPFKKPKLLQALYIGLFVLAFIILEYVSVQFGAITYHNGWNLAASTFFVIVMFPILTLHYRSPIVAWVLSVIFIFILCAIFDVTIDKMK